MRSWVLPVVVCMALIMLVGYKAGSNRGRVVSIVGKQDGVAISTSAPIAVTSAAKYSDAFRINESESHSVFYTIDVATAVSTTVEVQHSIDYDRKDPDSATWDSVKPTAITWSFTADEAGVRVLSLAVTGYIRFKFNEDGSSRAYDVDRLVVAHW